MHTHPMKIHPDDIVNMADTYALLCRLREQVVVSY